MRPIDKEERSRRSFWTVGKRLVLTAGIAVMVGFGTTMTIQLTAEREKTRADMAASSEAITRLLAAQMSGGVRWKKGDAVAATYAELVQAPGSEIASILVLDDANAPLVSYKSDRIQPFDLTQAATALAKDQSAALTRTDDAHLVVVAPIHAGKDNERVGTLAIAFGLDRLNSRLHANLVTGGLIAAGLLAVLMAVLAFLIGRVVSRPVTDMTKAMGQLADGNTTVTIPGAERRDEIGEMARAVEVFRESMIESARLRAEQEQLKAQAEAERQAAMAKLAGTFEASVKAMVDSVSSSASQMRGTAGEMATAADQASAQTTAAAAASEQASANVQTVASAAEELSSSISEIGRQVSESTKIAGQAVTEAERTNATVKSLADAAQRIGDVVKLISEIAGQTNLLALNATIEAARAGEAGKGFAVVASEVKSLATQTAKATEEIAAQIGAIQGATGESVAAIEGISATIGRINEIATSIAAAVEEQGAATQEIARNVQEAARGTSEVSSNVNGISKVTSNTGRAAGLVLSAAEAVAQQTDKLSAEVAAFVNKVRAA